MRVSTVAIATLILGANLASADPDYSQPLDEYTKGQALRELEELAEREGIDKETASILLKLDVAATSNDTGCPGVDVDVVNATGKTVWYIEVLVEQKDGARDRTDKLHLPYMPPNTKTRVSVSCLQDYTYRSRYDYSASTPISLSYSARGSKTIDEALPLMLEQKADYVSSYASVAPMGTPGASTPDLLEAALALEDEAVAKELVLAIARTGIGKDKLGAALARNGTGVLADEIVASMKKLPAKEQAQLARTLLASTVADRWQAQLDPMIDRSLCSGARADVVGLWIQAQMPNGIPVERYRERIREKCKPTKADGPGMALALDDNVEAAGATLDAVDDELFASVLAAWKARKGAEAPLSLMGFARLTQEAARFDLATALLTPAQLVAAIPAVLRAPDGAAASHKAAWVGEAVKRVEADQIMFIVTTSFDSLAVGEIKAAALRDAVKALAVLAPEAADNVLVTHGNTSSKVFDVAQLREAGIDVGEFLAFNATLGDCTALANSLAECALAISAWQGGVLTKHTRTAIKPEFATAMRALVDNLRDPNGLITLSGHLGKAGFDVAFLATRACNAANDAITWGGDPDPHLALGEQIAPGSECIAAARELRDSKKRRGIIFAILSILGLVAPLPIGGWLAKKKWKQVKGELPAETVDEVATGAKLDDRLGARGLGRGLHDGVGGAKRELAGTPAAAVLETVDETLLGLVASTVKRAVKAGDAATAIVRRPDQGHAVYIVALPVRHPRPQVVQRYLGAPWPEHLAKIRDVAGVPVLALVVLCGPDASEASLLVGYGDGVAASDPDVLLDAKEARDRGANRFRHVISLTDTTKAA